MALKHSIDDDASVALDEVDDDTVIDTDGVDKDDDLTSTMECSDGRKLRIETTPNNSGDDDEFAEFESGSFKTAKNALLTSNEPTAKPQTNPPTYQCNMIHLHAADTQAQIPWL